MSQTTYTDDITVMPAKTEMVLNKCNGSVSHPRSGPDSSQHVSDSRHQFGPGKSTRSGGHGSYSHAYRQHGYTWRTGGGSGDPRTVTYSTPAGVWDRTFGAYVNSCWNSVKIIFEAVHIRLQGAIKFFLFYIVHSSFFFSSVKFDVFFFYVW